MDFFRFKSHLHEISQQNFIDINLLEELTPQQKEIVDTWDTVREPHTQKEIDRVFKGGHQLSFDLPQENDVPHPDIQRHLENNGFKIKSYLNNKAVDKYNRETTIGRVLAKTKASEEIKKTFENDPVRQQQKDNLSVVVTHHPHHVAGMTSKCQSWEEESCMNFENGSNNEYLPGEVKAGTHVAYMVNNKDHDIKNPMARIALKPFHLKETGKPTHTIFRPESRVYGNAPASFYSSVKQWSKDNYPAKKDKEYLKDNTVYNDTGLTYQEVSDEHIKKKLANDDLFDLTHRHELEDSQKNMVADHIMNLTNTHERNSEMRALKLLDFFKPSHVNYMYNTAKSRPDDKDLMTRVVTNFGDKLNKENVEHAYNSGHDNDLVLGNKNMPEHVINKMNPWQLTVVDPKNIKPNHVDTLVNEVEKGKMGMQLVDIAKFHDHFTKEHLHKLIPSAVNDSGVSTLVSHPNFDMSHSEKLYPMIKDDKFNKYRFFMTNKHIKPEWITSDVKNEDAYNIINNAINPVAVKKAAQHIVHNEGVLALPKKAAQYLEPQDYDKLSHRIDLASHVKGYSIHPDVKVKMLDHLKNTYDPLHFMYRQHVYNTGAHINRFSENQYENGVSKEGFNNYMKHLDYVRKHNNSPEFDKLHKVLNRQLTNMK